MSDIFEHPWALLTAAVALLLILLLFRSIVPEKKRWWQLFLPLLLAGTAFGLDFLVQTDTEKIKTVINTIANALEEENADVIEPLITDNYRDPRHRTKQRLMRHCRNRFSKPVIEKNVARIVSTEFEDPKTAATVILTMRIVFSKQSYVYQTYKREIFVKLKFDLQKQPGNQWLIRRIEILELDRMPFNY